jgi:hypothetical protein
MKNKGFAGLAVLAIAFCAAAPAQIRRLSLEEMVELADSAIVGTIVNTEVFRVDDPVDGPELYYTTLTIEGQSLVDGTPLTVQVTFNGGLINETEGVYNSEAPAKDDVLIGNTVTAFYRWQDNMGGGVAANALSASHGGLYRVLAGTFVLGRGEGYAIANNITVENLSASLDGLYRAKLGK